MQKKAGLINENFKGKEGHLISRFDVNLHPFGKLMLTLWRCFLLIHYHILRQKRGKEKDKEMGETRLDLTIN